MYRQLCGRSFSLTGQRRALRSFQSAEVNIFEVYFPLLVSKGIDIRGQERRWKEVKGTLKDLRHLTCWPAFLFCVLKFGEVASASHRLFLHAGLGGIRAWQLTTVAYCSQASPASFGAFVQVCSGASVQRPLGASVQGPVLGHFAIRIPRCQKTP